MVGAITLGVFLPFLGTAIGAATVFLLKDGINGVLQKLLLGIASGVMIAASVWSLIIPAAELSALAGMPQWLPPALGVMLGVAALLSVDGCTSNLKNAKKGVFQALGDQTLLFLSVTLHNIPEGMAVGAVFAGLIAAERQISLAGALALSVGIALQNFPEGAIVSLPLKAAGKGRVRSFFFGVASGVVEPIAAGLTIAFSTVLVPILPYLLSFAAGAMIYVVFQELVPSAKQDGRSFVATVGVAFGFVLMMVLDMALG
ncbi:MAG: ZIP family metal transporter [Clostridia bacterium]|nr:ZIP family metal transporter [Clostridia bacterium]